ncbi:BCL4p [Phlyctema vagabunda]|uniref:BCL4p n=1 Tax=Phlyctema vagabunda TaxID=108571 RepID=A0ABR4P1S1_9HELO
MGLNMTKWFEMISFDILGEMAFGEGFHCVEDGMPHFWSEMIVKHLFFITVLDNLRRYPMIAAIGRWLLPQLTVSVRNKHCGFSRRKVARRLGSTTTRKDFLATIVDKVRVGEVSQEELTAHASTLIIAGGETVSTFLAAVTYFLLRNPAAYRKLKNEIRMNFSSYNDITSSATQRLPYLQAVISEGLRIYPPGSQGFPRTCPGAYIDGFYVPRGTEVYTSAWTVTHNKNSFHDPYQFKPERWTESACSDIRGASQPFSLGSRGCLGKNFAYVEMNLVLAKMHFRYDLELIDRELDWLEQSSMYVMWWKPELLIRFKYRENEQTDAN